MELSDKNNSVTLEEYQLTKNKNIFEEVIDKMMLESFTPEFSNKIMNMPLKDKRMSILSLLDKDRNLFLGIKGLINSGIGKYEHIKDVVLMLREYVKVGEVEKKKFGEVMTPLELVKEMLATLPEEVWSNPNLKWLDPANGTGPYPLMVIYRLMNGLKDWEPDEEKRYKHIVEKMIYVCELQPKNMFLYMCAVDPWDMYQLNIYTGSFLEEGFDKHMKEVWGFDKFDIVIMNPPYNKMIDMDFVKKSYLFSDSILCVHPSTWLLDEKNKQKKFTTTKDLIKNDLISIKLFNGNGVFGISLFVPCVITYINKNIKQNGILCVDRINEIEFVYKNINNINKFHSQEYISIKNKLELNKDTVNLHVNKPSNKYWVNISRIRGHVNLKGHKMLQDDFYTLIPKERIVELERGRERGSKTQFSFKSELEAKNFLKYIKTDFVRFCVAIFKNKCDLDCGELNLIPWLDFTQEWTDEKLYKEFDLTEEEIKFIEKHIPKYY
jgi:hypothetical protein